MQLSFCCFLFNWKCFGNSALPKIRGKKLWSHICLVFLLFDMPTNPIGNPWFSPPSRESKQQPRCKCMGLPHSHRILLLYPQRVTGPWWHDRILFAEQNHVVNFGRIAKTSLKLDCHLVDQLGFANKKHLNKLYQTKKHIHHKLRRISTWKSSELKKLGGPEFIAVPSCWMKFVNKFGKH